MEDYFPDPSSYSSIARTDCRIACKVLTLDKRSLLENGETAFQCMIVAFRQRSSEGARSWRLGMFP
jgi:hypothetical protein